ncbi:type I secretion system permease/ATPase [Vibrio mediterranei]|uniref:type I secretion system permease/ATPase n=1 Tax=Vibrio mediterranei TaxID=689 RepID=UPI00148CD2F6|nr:type I secretion system permease/ATPase [Vibrio mediterranei]NOI22751.1 type I secretion system permease/ATPase [Vibrio mediterranei]
MERNNKDNWLEAVQWLCRHFEVRCHPVKIKSGLPLDDGKLSESLFVRALERHEIDIMELSTNELTKASLPCVVIESKERTPLIITCIDGQQVTYLEVANDFQQSTVDVSEFRTRVDKPLWQINAASKVDQRAEDLKQRTPTHWLLMTLKEVKPWYRDLLVASFVINVLALVVPLFTMNVYDRVVPNQAFNTLWVLSAGVAIIIVFDWILKESRSSVTDMASRYVDNKLSSQLFSKTMGMKLENRPQSVGAFSRQLQDFDSVKEFLTSVTLVTLVDLPFTVLFLVLIGWLGGAMMLIPMGVMLLLVTISIAMKRKVESTLEETSRFSTQRQAQLIESLNALSEIKQNNAQGLLQKRWEQVVASLSTWQTRSRTYTNIISHSIQSSQQVVTVSLIVFGVYQISEGLLTMGGLIAIVMLSGRAGSSINQLSMLMLRYQQSKTAMEGLNQIMSLPQEDTNHQVLERGTFNGRIKLDNVGFIYPEMQSEVLSGIDLEIQAGERVGIVGAAGAGKSTLMSLLLKQYAPSSGQVYFEGLDSKLWPHSVLRETTGWVAQHSVLFFGSVFENITFGDTQFDEKRLAYAIQFSGLNDYMPRLVNGLETQVGEGGRNLSGGQRQAVALARALYRQPKLLALDEPTSALDSQAEQRFYQALLRMPKDITMVISSHRQSFLALCDRVLVLERGKIVLEGTPKEIFERRSSKHKVKNISVVKGGNHEH